MGCPVECQNGGATPGCLARARRGDVNFPIPAALAEVAPDAPLGVLLERLTAAERERAAGFAAEKRRHDWIRGRAAAKEAVRARVAQDGGAPPDYGDFEVVSDPSGAPRVAGLEGAIAVSLTHGHGWGAALATRPGSGGGLPGVDLERVRPRPQGTLRFYLHPEERAPLEGLPGGEGEEPGPRDLASIVLWSLKEAAFKALVPPRGTGLLDLEVELLDSFDALTGDARVRTLEGAAARAGLLGVEALHAGWRREGDLVLAWALAAGARLPDAG